MDCKIPVREAIPRDVDNTRTDVQWKAPDIGCYKANCSAVGGKDGYKTGIGVTNEMNHIVNGGHMLASYGHILEEIEVLNRNNPGTRFRSTSRVANHVALWLAKYGLESADNVF
ncbi:hypothetical protein QYF36_013690 [Acer negundo]|nr:hypothetical protein QYF36_013690 [Acer negundo]